ncbi:MAG: transposase [Candidatus Limosilactobacillus merdavium]|uniref:Transposase n=1 Tax=Candidatus Limosilactobacillus merdavium TaxID=2838651 RepID=A0A9E2KV16_9LACO|nr:transposase [Candidatus Limosilactobacillus merdavium]
MIRTEKVRLYPNRIMCERLDNLCDYRRYCWNQGLALWNDMYDESCILGNKKLQPNERKVRNELVYNKADWQYNFSARCLQLAISDLGKAWKNFFNKAQPDWGKPQFKSKKAPRQGFKTDRAKIIHGMLRLDKPKGTKNWFDIRVKGAKSLDGELKVVSIFRENGKYWAVLPFETNMITKPQTGRKTAVDVNVGHFNTPKHKINTLPEHLQFLYSRIKHYQRQLARKREVNGRQATKSNNYQVTRAKLQRDYHRVANIQHDLIQKFTTQLINHNDTIVVEDLAVKQMQMSHVASKGLQRSMFGYFRQVLSYKCDWYGRKLILADQHYPSTQRCSLCGYVKKGDEKITLQGNKKHHTKHNEYVCYQCGAVMDRDENAVQNLLQLS